MLLAPPDYLWGVVLSGPTTRQTRSAASILVAKSMVAALTRRATPAAAATSPGLSVEAATSLALQAVATLAIPARWPREEIPRGSNYSHPKAAHSRTPVAMATRRVASPMMVMSQAALFQRRDIPTSLSATVLAPKASVL